MQGAEAGGDKGLVSSKPPRVFLGYGHPELKKLLSRWFESSQEHNYNGSRERVANRFKVKGHLSPTEFP